MIKLSFRTIMIISFIAMFIIGVAFANRLTFNSKLDPFTDHDTSYVYLLSDIGGYYEFGKISITCIDTDDYSVSVQPATVKAPTSPTEVIWRFDDGEVQTMMWNTRDSDDAPIAAPNTIKSDFIKNILASSSIVMQITLKKGIQRYHFTLDGAETMLAKLVCLK